MLERNPTNQNKSNRTPGVQEMFISSNVPSSTLPTSVSSTNDASGISQQEEYLPDPLLHSVLSCNYEPSTSEDSLSIPCLINLETAGLRRSPRISELNGVTQDGPAIVAYTCSTTQLKSQWTTRSKPKLSFLSIFNSVGALWTFGTTNPHSDCEHLSFVAQIANDFEQINGLFDDMINETRHHIQAYTTSNETSTYSQMLCEDAHVKLFEAMEVKIDNHETHHNWDLMLCTDLPLGTITIMAIWSFKCKRISRWDF
jgi:hypothetical protein